MKCVSKDNEIKRVSNENAEDLVNNKGWSFCSKKCWKLEARNIKQVKEVVIPAFSEETTEVKVVEKKKRVSGRQREKTLGNN
jgi:hypothetical protein